MRGGGREQREIYCSEESVEDNEAGASGSIEVQRKEDKREGR